MANKESTRTSDVISGNVVLGLEEGALAGEGFLATSSNSSPKNSWSFRESKSLSFEFAPDQKKYPATCYTGIYFLSAANIALCIVFAPAIKIEIAIITENYNYLCSKTLTAPYGTHKYFLKTRTHSAK